jgi:hypothetical protein
VDVQTVPRMDNENYVERLGDLCRALPEHLTNPYGAAAGSSCPTPFWTSAAAEQQPDRNDKRAADGNLQQ